MRELCINIYADLPRIMFGNKSSGILSELARVLAFPKARRPTCTSVQLGHRLEQAQRKIRARQESYFVLMQYPWCKP